MEQKSKNISLKAILIAIGAGIWVIVLQNAGIIPKLVGTENGTQTVYVTGGNIDADINGTVDIRGSVSVDNEVDVDIKKVNGWEAANYYEYTIDGKEFHSLGTR
ncbi:hypothetical protein CAPN001_04110 [Capnocytophaga stomatis]|uniref:hypothetical protein n=1 Tax=Capnocytophaga stomatis TaxID=1848904 RepID=UPI001950C02D|nr:hypothetical protein [Capnocytophaga stomatis]GIJ95842.1 hypothetical protein CAPN001_04110 [Capnocytophaga stomatis]